MNKEILQNIKFIVAEVILQNEQTQLQSLKQASKSRASYNSEINLNNSLFIYLFFFFLEIGLKLKNRKTKSFN